MIKVGDCGFYKIDPDKGLGSGVLVINMIEDSLVVWDAKLRCVTTCLKVDVISMDDWLKQKSEKR